MSLHGAVGVGCGTGRESVTSESKVSCWKFIVEDLLAITHVTGARLMQFNFRETALFVRRNFL